MVECCIPACCMNILLPVFRGLQMVSFFLFGLLNRHRTDILLLVSLISAVTLSEISCLSSRIDTHE